MPRKPLPEVIDFPGEEEKVLQFWTEIRAFETQLKQSKGKPPFTFYDGPPFATGLPHYGHILTGTIKDIVTRWASGSGHFVERRFGWDCHGLPIEFEIDKAIGIKSPDDVRKLGIGNYNNECRKIVGRFSKEWEAIVTRMGRWIDFKNDYKTMYPEFMESVWFVFKELFNKGLVYRGFKVMPFSTACATPLSNFEVSQNYKDVNDPEVVVSFPLDDEPGTSLLAWTTTPWTLPSNLALCVNPALEYVRVRDNKGGAKYIVMKCRLAMLDKAKIDYEVESEMLGKALEGKGYAPLFPYFADRKARGAFRVLCDGYVTTESGTGVVHQAPFFGEDDYRVCVSYGVVVRDEADIVCPVDASGRFTEPVSDFLGQHVKDADKAIMASLKSAGRLLHQGQFNHSYPFCWRSDTPLIYKAVPCWFIRVEPLREQLIENNKETYWVPDFVKEKRFANGLKDAPDWCVSRNRFWGTPLPLWVSEDFQESVCIGSIEELERLSGAKVTDLHRENIDGLTIPSRRKGGAPLRRVEEVFDCWFESGSMPYAQSHYPFENKKAFEDSFPADFIAEGIDQTRGWFYTLSVLSTALFGKPPFKNLIANGLVLAEDGNKMSKRKMNYPDPSEIINKYGADAVRMYLINSPVVRGENLRFREAGVRDILRDVFLPWVNAYRFLCQNLDKWESESGVALELGGESGNVMDRWIVSATHTLVAYVREEMDAFRLYTVVPRLVKFVDTLTNCYVRMNRKRLKGEGGSEDAGSALGALWSVLETLDRIMAPFTPFLAEVMWRNLGQGGPASVHWTSLPEPDAARIDAAVERRVDAMRTVVELGRTIRERNTIPIKYPVKEIVVLDANDDLLKDVESMEGYIKEEMNARVVRTSKDKAKWGVKLAGVLDMTLGKKLRKDFQEILKQIKVLPEEQLAGYQKTGKLTICGHELSGTDLTLTYVVDPEKVGGSYEAHSDGQTIVLVDVSEDQSMVDEGLAREIVNRVQKLRKKAKLAPTDAVLVQAAVSPPDSDLARVLKEQLDFILNTVKQPMEVGISADPASPVLIQETMDVKGSQLSLVILDKREGAADAPAMPTSLLVQAGTVPPSWAAGPDSLCVVSADGRTAALRLSAGPEKLHIRRLRLEVSSLFGLWALAGFELRLDSAAGAKVDETTDLAKLKGRKVVVCPL